MSFDESKFYLGTLCKRSHDYENSGLSLRYIRNREICVSCNKERCIKYYKEGSRKHLADIPIKECPTCKRKFKSTHKGQKYCDMACYHKSRLHQEKTCPICTKKFHPKKAKQKFCSPKCRQKACKKHGLSNHPLYFAHNAMKSRCYNPKFRGYEFCGAKGIKICDKWLNNFLNFYNWAISNSWKEKNKFQVIRIDKKKDFSPKNCILFKKTPNKIVNTPLYNCYLGIKSRCSNPKNKSYKHYGTKGIKMCDEWSDDIMNFYNWAIDNKWKKGLQLHRIDRNGNYSPENCKWVTRYEHIKLTNKEKHENVLQEELQKLYQTVTPEQKNQIKSILPLLEQNY